MCLFSIKTVTLSLLNIDLMKNVSQLCSSEMIGMLVKNPVVEMFCLYLIPYVVRNIIFQYVNSQKESKRHDITVSQENLEVESLLDQLNKLNIRSHKKASFDVLSPGYNKFLVQDSLYKSCLYKIFFTC